MGQREILELLEKTGKELTISDLQKYMEINRPNIYNSIRKLLKQKHSGVVLVATRPIKITLTIKKIEREEKIKEY